MAFSEGHLELFNLPIFVDQGGSFDVGDVKGGAIFDLHVHMNSCYPPGGRRTMCTIWYNLLCLRVSCEGMQGGTKLVLVST